MEEMVWLARQPARPAVHLYAAILADGIPYCFGAGNRQVVAIKVDIARDI
jgi:hypothetical protein